MFYFNEGSLTVSEEWQDRSLILLAHPSNLSISISREKLSLGMTFSEYVEQQFILVGKQLKSYQENNRFLTQIEGLDAVISEFEWQSPDRKLYQISAIIDVPKNPVIITASSPTILTENQKKHLLTIIHSFKTRTTE